jgi:cobalt-zinc-cadmium efflux system outer membrane protein
VAASRRGFEAGRFSFYALAQAQDTLFRLRERGVEAATRYHLLLIEIERLTASAEDSTP